MKNHTNKLPFGCAQCNLGFKLKIDLIKHCQTAHNGIVVLQESNSEEEILKESETLVKAEEQSERPQNEQEQATVIQYILDAGDNNVSQSQDQASESEAQYTVVNISDVSAFQNAHTVIEEPKNTTRILSSTLNEDGTTTLMVATEPGMEEAIDEKTVVFLRMPDEN